MLSSFVSMASAAGVAATSFTHETQYPPQRLNGLCGRCRCDQAANAIDHAQIVSMASAAGVAATLALFFS